VTALLPAPSSVPGRALLPSPSSSTSRLGALDALRFVAALSVVAFHFTARDSPGWGGSVPAEIAGVGQWTMYGRLGVPLFFVISGFVLLMSSWGRDLPSFVASRVGRLFPAYWVAVAVSTALVVYLWPENAAFFGKAVSSEAGLLNLTMVQSAFGVPNVDGVYWTLWYEARFYLLIAVLMAVGMTRARILAFCALWPVVGALASRTESNLVTALLMPDYAPFFAGGMLLYLIYRDGHDLGTWLLVGVQGAFALNFALTAFPYALDAETPFTPSRKIVALVTVLCFALVALVTLTRVASWNARWMTAAGALTYPLYLIHENLGWAVITKTQAYMGPWTAVALATIVALAAAVLLHRFVEQPFGGRLRRATLAMIRRTAQPAEARDAREHTTRLPAPRHSAAADTGRPSPGAQLASRRAGSRTAPR
jgi:peptidoglycan/LPS O-acetylase OafA/YrhL